jgi:hypothetical protein
MPIGEHKISSIPKLIAGFLKLPGGPEYLEYKSHSFRHSGATILSEDGISPLNLQQAGGWHSQAVAQSYVESTTSSAISTSKRMMREEDRANSLANIVNSDSTSSTAVTTTFPTLPTINQSGTSNKISLALNISSTTSSSSSAP